MSQSKVTLKWNGDDLLSTIQGNSEDALFAAGEILLETAVALAPEDDGDLKASGYVATVSKSSYKAGAGNNRQIKPKANEAVVGFSRFYAMFLERGTSRMAARPYMRPALDQRKDDLAKEAIKRLGDGLE